MKKTLLLTLLVLVASVAMGQELRKFSIVSFEEKPFDMTATDPRYKIEDGNGALFSIIKLVAETPDDDLTAYSFDFGLCEDREKSVDGERWIYVQRNAMHVTIKREGFQTVKAELNLTVQEGKVYQMVLRAAPRVVKKRYFLFKVHPADSKAQIQYKLEGESEFRVFADGQIDEEGMASEKLELGIYHYRITSRLYKMSEGRIELIDSPETHVEEVELIPNYGTLALTAVDNADIYIDGEKMGTATWNGILKPGSYKIESVLKNHRNSEEYIEIKEGDVKEMKLKSPIPITGSIDISSSPLGATITIDGKEYGKTPNAIEGLLIGEHTITISKNGYQSESRDIVIKEGKNDEEMFDLKKQAGNGNVYVASSPKGASITIGGKSYGETPKTIENILPGTYNISVSKNGYQTKSNIVVIEAGKTKTVNITLEKTAKSTPKPKKEKNNSSAYSKAFPSTVNNSGKGSINVTSNPTLANISIGGKDYGLTPKVISDLQPGSYNVYVYKRGYPTALKRVSVEAGKTKFVNVNLKKSESLFNDASFYFGTGVRVTSTNSWMIYCGGYAWNVNCELFFFTGWDKAPFILKSGKYSYDAHVGPTAAGGIKLGYGIKASKRFRFTPQVGTTFMSISGYADSEYGIESESENWIATYPVLLDFGVKCDFALGDIIGLTITPEYNYAIKKDELFKSFESFSTKIKRWGNGFNLGFGVYFSF